MKYAFRHIDETFDIDNCTNYILSIRCSPDGFSFSIFDTTVSKFIALMGFTLNEITPFMLRNSLIGIFSSETILARQFKKVHICYYSNKMTLVPAALFDRHETENTMSLLFEQERDCDVVVQKLKDGVVALSLIPVLIKNFFNEHFHNCKFITPLEPVLQHDTNYNQARNRVHIEIQNHVMMLVAFKEHSLFSVNTFYVHNAADCLYHIINLTRNAGFDQKTAIIASGSIESKGELIGLLKKYFEIVVLARYSSNYAYSYTFFDEPDHNHVLLTELAQCE